MDEARFWQLIDEVRTTASSERTQVRELKRRLTELPLADVVAFDATFTAVQQRLNTWDLWGAAYVINGGCSDDGFIDFRSWVIAQGSDTYRRALTHPDSLIEVLPTGGRTRRFGRRTLSLGAEPYSYAAEEVYEQRTGNEIYDEHPEPDPDAVHSWEPQGEPFEEDADALRQRYPRLAAVFLP